MPSNSFLSAHMSQTVISTSMRNLVRTAFDQSLLGYDAERESFVEQLICDAFASGLSVIQTLALCDMAARTMGSKHRQFLAGDLLAEYLGTFRRAPSVSYN